MSDSSSASTSRSARSSRSRANAAAPVGAGTRRQPSVPAHVSARCCHSGSLWAISTVAARRRSTTAWAGAAGGGEGCGSSAGGSRTKNRDPLPGSTFDLVHARLILVHLPERERALANMAGALKPRGWLVCEEFDSLSLPADPALHPAECVLKAQAATQPFDVAFEVSGTAAGLASAIGVVRRGGIVVQVGNLPGGQIPVPANAVMAKEIDLRGSFRFGTEFFTAVELIADGSVDVLSLVTAQRPLSVAPDAVRLALDRSQSVKVVLTA